MSLKLLALALWGCVLLAQAIKPPAKKDPLRNASTEAATTTVESPEHAAVRKSLESATQEFEDSKKDYETQTRPFPEGLEGATKRCSPSASPLTHPVSFEEVQQRMSGCRYEVVKLRYVMEVLGEVKQSRERQLSSVDECVRTYKATIDKKIADQTMRESLQIKMCQQLDLYPPPTSR